jgi:hypothetical protein
LAKNNDIEMEESSLINLLKTFDLITWHLAEKFVRSPAHNQRADVIVLFDYLFFKRPLDDPKHLKQELVFKKVFPNQVFDEKKMRYTRSFLFQVLLEMLAWQGFKEEDGNLERYAAHALQTRGLEKDYDRNLRDAELAAQQSPIRNSKFYFQQYSILAERYAFENSKNRRSAVHFQGFSDALSVFFMAERLRQTCTALSHKVFSETDFKQDFIPEILAIIEERDFSHVPPIMIYYHSYKALSAQDGTADFYKLRALISQYSQVFTPDERRDIYLLAINYCIRQVNSGKQFFLDDILDLYKEGIEKEAFLENGYLSRYTYTNISLAGIGLRKFEETEAFIHAYKDKIEMRYRDSAFNYNLALLFFRKMDYDKALELLRYTEFNDVLHNLDARRMMLRIYYDLGETEALFSLLDSFSIFLRRQKGLGYHRNHYGNLLKFTRKLLQLPPQNETAKELLRQEIEKTTEVAEKKWLLEQLIKSI